MDFCLLRLATPTINWASDAFPLRLGWLAKEDDPKPPELPVELLPRVRDEVRVRVPGAEERDEPNALPEEAGAAGGGEVRESTTVPEASAWMKRHSPFRVMGSL